MKKSRKLMMVLLAVLIIAMIPTTAFAKKAKKGGKGGKWYVPTAGSLEHWDAEKNAWVSSNETFTANFDNKGRVKAVTFVNTDPDTQRVWWSETSTYTWKGDFIKSSKDVETYTNIEGKVSGSTYETTYKYKGKKPSRRKHTYTSTNSDGRQTYYSSSDAQYKWGKKQGVVATEYHYIDYKEDGSVADDGGSRSADMITLKKGRKGASFTSYTTYKYYANGNLRSAVTNNTGSKETTVSEYNKAGFLVKYTRTWVVQENGSPKTQWSTTTYNWQMNGKQPVSVESSNVVSEGEANAPQKWTFTSVKKVKQSRNCDAFGTQVWLEP